MVYRGNTGNAGYGLEQIKARDGKMSITRNVQNKVGDYLRFNLGNKEVNHAHENADSSDDDDEPNKYRFSVAANVKGYRKPQNPITGN